MPAERAATPSFLDNLRASNLLDRAQLQDLARCPEARDPAPAPLARVVLQRGWLTRFQLNTIATGRGAELTVGPYLLLDRLGEGAMGMVYKARHQHMQRVVALKVIRREKLANPESVKRFYQEVQLAAQLSHPNIVLAYDAGPAGNTHYMAMEYVDGVDLARLVKENGPLPLPQACDYVRQAALGLQHAHEKGLVHRDIKPHNLLVSRAADKTDITASAGTAAASRGDVVKVLDMGLARLQGGGDTGMTKIGAVIGTPDYLAPEQAMNSKSADIRADLYSLGCTLHYLLTGQPPFIGGELTELLLKHQMEKPPTLAQRGVRAPQEVQAVLDKLMAKHPDDRYQTPADLIEALTPFCRAGTLAATAISAVRDAGRADDEWASLTLDDNKDKSSSRAAKSERSGELSRTSAGARVIRQKRGEAEAAGQRKKRLVLVGVACGACLVAVAAFAVLLFVVFGSPKPAAVAKAPPPEAVKAVPPEAQKPMEAQKPAPADGPREAAVGPAVKDKARPPADNGPKPAPPANEGDDRPPPPKESVKPAPPPRRDDSPPAPKEPPQPPPPDGPVPVVPGRLVRPPGQGQISALALSPDGKRATWATNRIQVWDMESDKPLHDCGGKVFKSVSCCAWSPDNRQFAIGCPEGEVVLLDAATGKVVRNFVGHATEVHAIAFSADGRYLLTGAGPERDCDVRRWEVETGKQAGAYQGGPRWPPMAVCFGPDDKTVLVLPRHFDETCYEWPVDDGDTPHRIPLPAQGNNGKAFSPDGRAVARIEIDRVLRVYELPSGKELRHSGELPQAYGVRWSRDGHTITCGSGYSTNTKTGGVMYLLDAATCKELKRCAANDEGVSFTESGPGGRCAIASIGSGAVRSWHGLDRDVPPPEKVAFSGHEGPVECVAFSADGKKLVSGGWDHTVRVWDVADGSEQKQFLHDVTPYRAAFAGKGSLVVGAGRDLGFRCWELETGRQVNAGNYPKAGTEALSPDGEYYLNCWTKNSVGPRRTIFRDGAEPSVSGSWDTVRAVSFAPDSRSAILAGSDGLLHVLDMTAHREVGKGFQGPKSPVVCLAVSPRATYLVTAAEDKSVMLWSLQSFSALRRFTGHKDKVSCLAFSPDGKHVVTGGADATVRVWDLAGKQVAQSGEHKEAVQGVAFSPDGKSIASCGDGIKLWEWQTRPAAKP
jgi:serine/threonine protein kinase/WD40 repeat protein